MQLIIIRLWTATLDVVHCFKCRHCLYDIL